MLPQQVNQEYKVSQSHIDRYKGTKTLTIEQVSRYFWDDDGTSACSLAAKLSLNHIASSSVSTMLPQQVNQVPLASTKKSPLAQFNPTVQNLKLKEMFKGLEGIKFGKVSKNSWDDDKLMDLPGVRIYECDKATLNDTAIRVLKSLYHSINERSVADIFMLAWHLVSPSGTGRVFPAVDPTDSEKNVEISSLSTTPINSPCSIVDISIRSSDPDLVCAGAYVSASLLRLLTKPAENYVHAWDHIRAGYKRFYNRPFPYPTLMPMKDNIVSIQRVLQNSSVMRNTITGFLYSVENLVTDQGICRILYEKHLSCTGMHAYPLFVQACAILKLKSEELLGALVHRMTLDGLEVIQTILNHHEDPDLVSEKEARKHKTWRYARLFDDAAFADLQTKNCLALVATLAYLNKHLGAQKAGDVLAIQQLKTISDESKAYYQKAATRIYMWAITKTT